MSSIVDEYIKKFPKEIQEILQKVRKTIQDSAPGATEVISYGIPTFDMGGKHLVHFAAFKKHIGFFPTPSAIRAFESELSDYKISKGTIQFSYKKTIPLGLIKKIVRYRVKENKFEKL